MIFRQLLAGSLLAASATALHAQAVTFRYAYQGGLNGLDPYTLNETFTLSALGNVYEGLVRRNAKLELEPALAESWEKLSPTHWRFHLRKDVRFHDGGTLTADDVVFSAERVRSEGSDLGTRVPTGAQVVAVDSHTVDFLLKSPAPALPAEWETWYIMDKEWSHANGATSITSASSTTPGFAALKTNGTGPYRVISHEPGLKTVYEKNGDWWDASEGMPDRVEFSAVTSGPTRVAALLSGELDMIYPVPVQDIARLEQNPATSVLAGPELRTLFLGMDQSREELLYSSVKGKNPLKDVRVRKAIYQAIDMDAIASKIMRGTSAPAALLISPALFPRAGEFARLPYDPEASRRLLAEAGYPEGFSLTLDCPNDRYVNDAGICEAAAAMLSKAGIRTRANTQPKAKYFGRILPTGGYDTSFYLFGWTPADFDSFSLLQAVAMCRDTATGQGAFNIGGYCNPQVDALIRQLASEEDKEKRAELTAQIYTLLNRDVAYIPLHQQKLAWGVSNRFQVEQRADDQLLFRFVRQQ